MTPGAWRRQLEDLADGFRVLAWDAPGAGESSDSPDDFTISDWADVPAGFLDAVGVREANLVGLSWGGLLAKEFYRLYPSRVLRLVLAGTYAGWLGSFGEDVARQRLERCKRESHRPPEEFVAGWVPVEFFHEASAELTDEMTRVVSDFRPAGFRLMAKSLAEADTTELLEQIAVPVLLLWGEGDRRSPMEVADRFDSLISGAELVRITGAGHVTNMETPERFNAEVRRSAKARSWSDPPTAVAYSPRSELRTALSRGGGEGADAWSALDSGIQHASITLRLVAPKGDGFDAFSGTPGRNCGLRPHLRIHERLEDCVASSGKDERGTEQSPERTTFRRVVRLVVEVRWPCVCPADLRGA